MELKTTLTDIGLEEKEAIVYIELLKLGEATATKIAEKTSLDRTLMYQLANKLINKGLVSFVIKNNVKYFIATNPKQLLQNLQEKEQQLEKALPQLENLTKIKELDTKVEVYREREGLKTILKDMLRVGEDYLVLGEERKLQSIIPLYLDIFLKRIVKMNIHERVLIREDFRRKIPKSKNSKFKYVPRDYLSPVTTLVYGNKVAHLILSAPFYAVLTTNKELADSFRSHFELLWKISKK